MLSLIKKMDNPARQFGVLLLILLVIATFIVSESMAPNFWVALVIIALLVLALSWIADDGSYNEFSSNSFFICVIIPCALAESAVQLFRPPKWGGYAKKRGGRKI